MAYASPMLATAPTAPYSDDAIARRIGECPKLASLQCINRALGELVRSEQSLNSQIAEVIRRDPSLSARLLRMVNSVYFGLSARVNNIEEAVFFLGLRQIRELSMATPVIEEIEQLQQNVSGSLPWKELWTHSLGTAILTREILAATPLHIDDDTDYLVGLLHNVGKVVMAYAFPVELRTLMNTPATTPDDHARLERELIGWDHARIGADYLRRHQLSEEIIHAVSYHNEPDRAPRHRPGGRLPRALQGHLRWVRAGDTHRIRRLGRFARLEDPLWGRRTGIHARPRLDCQFPAAPPLHAPRTPLTPPPRGSVRNLRQSSRAFAPSRKS
jgi:HD-like signal output (HDOD) protein